MCSSSGGEGGVSGARGGVCAMLALATDATLVDLPPATVSAAPRGLPTDCDDAHLRAEMEGRREMRG